MTFKENIRAMTKAAEGAACAIDTASHRLASAGADDPKAAAVGRDADLLDALDAYNLALGVLQSAVTDLAALVASLGERV